MTNAVCRGGVGVDEADKADSMGRSMQRIRSRWGGG